MTLKTNDVNSLIFSCPHWIFVCLFWRNIYEVLHPFVFIVELCFLYILQINSLSDIWFANIFPHLVHYLFTLWHYPLKHSNFWTCPIIIIMSNNNYYLIILIMSNLSSFSFVAYTFGVIAKKQWPNPRPWKLTLVFYKEFYLILLGLWLILKEYIYIMWTEVV